MTSGGFSLGGDSMPSAKFEKAGDSITGTVVDLSERQSTKLGTQDPDFWDDAKTQPKMYFRLILQTTQRDPAIATDDGKRSVALTGSRKAESQSSLSAVLGAVAAAVGGNELQPGGTVTLTMTGTAPSQTVGFNPRKTFTAKYEPPTMSFGATPPAAAQATTDQAGVPLATPTQVAGGLGAGPKAGNYSAEDIQAFRNAGVDMKALGVDA